MNSSDTKKFTTRVTAHAADLKLEFTTGEGRGHDTKVKNYYGVKDILTELGMNNTIEFVKEGAAIVAKIVFPGRMIEVAAPEADNGSVRKLAALIAGKSTVSLMINGIEVSLDNDQMKHQPISHPIGSRNKGGGNKFNNTGTIAWHEANTLVHMADWAATVNPPEGVQTFHGQATPVDGIHYEGYCLMAGGRKYVLFHCYPADNNKDLKL